MSGREEEIRVEGIREMRTMDNWLRRMAILGPICAFLLGWGSGLLTAAVLYKDHEKRIQSLETYKDAHGRWAGEELDKVHDRLLDLEVKTGIRRPGGGLK